MDVSFPAHITVTEEIDDDGLPIIDATVTPAPEATALALPPGPLGAPGPQGLARAPFRKMGAIANVGARPAGLGAEDRGKWWHRLDNNGMDVWTGSTWIHDVNAVGAQGAPAPGAAITPTTTHDAALTVPAVKFTGSGPALALAATAPAGVQGNQGPAGASGAISTATDFDPAVGPAQRGLFAYSLGARKWRATPAPNGFSWWSWYDSDFNADSEMAAERLTAGTFYIPPLPFAYRPMVWGRLAIYCQTNQNSDAEIRVRIGNETGPMVGSGAGLRSDGGYLLTAFGPCIGDSAAKKIAPSSTLASVPAHQETFLVVNVERIGQTTTGQIGYRWGLASLTVWAQPIL